MYELLVLALLMRWPLHAYHIAGIANSILGPWEKISRGSLSALLKKLEQAAFITATDPAHVPFPIPTDRPARVFALTSTGHDRFVQLMMDTTSNQGTYQRLFRIKALHLEFVSSEDQLYLVDHYITYCQTGFRYQKTEAQEFATNPRKQEQASDPCSAASSIRPASDGHRGFPIKPDAPLEEFAAIAPHHPVFRVGEIIAPASGG
jgi:DNA-binding PadR family transcriptional regulator